VAEAFDGESINWNARVFPGFFYDLHEDLGREEIFITASFADDSNRAQPAALVYLYVFSSNFTSCMRLKIRSTIKII